ncbi:MAG TPA: thioredoxin domain-containing protein [Actinomycetes bacterium]
MTDLRPARRNGTRPPRESLARAAERRADRRLRLTLLAVVGAVLLGLVLAVVVVGDDESGSTQTAKVRAGAVVPTGVSATTWAVTAYPGVTPKPGAPTLEVWEDFQCPACAATEERTGDLIESLARSGEIRLVWRPTTFLDERLGNDASQRAVEAWGCAVDAGVGPEYHRTVFANQPQREGDGYTDEQLVSFGRTAGLSGSAQDTFEQCATSGRYRQWAINSTAAFYDAGVPGTPAGYLDGEELPSGTLADGKALLAAVRAAG